MKSFGVMLAFFTRIPVHVNGDWDALFKSGIKYFFVVGLLLGLPMGGVMQLEPFAGPYLSAFIALTVYLLVCGALHVDGMADTVDGFAACRDREGTLAVMKDSRTGAFGVLAICMYAVGMTICLAQALPEAVWLFPLAGRLIALLCARLFRCAKPDGLGAMFIGGVKTVHVAAAVTAWVAACAVVSLVMRGAEHMWPCFAALMGAAVLSIGAVVLVISRMARRIGGITGDVIGFSVEVSQLVFLLGACVADIIL